MYVPSSIPLGHCYSWMALSSYENSSAPYLHPIPANQIVRTHGKMDKAQELLDRKQAVHVLSLTRPFIAHFGVCICACNTMACKNSFSVCAFVISWTFFYTRQQRIGSLRNLLCSFRQSFSRLNILRTRDCLVLERFVCDWLCSSEIVCDNFHSCTSFVYESRSLPKPMKENSWLKEYRLPPFLCELHHARCSCAGEGTIEKTCICKLAGAQPIEQNTQKFPCEHPERGGPWKGNVSRAAIKSPRNNAPSECKWQVNLSPKVQKIQRLTLAFLFVEHVTMCMHLFVLHVSVLIFVYSSGQEEKTHSNKLLQTIGASWFMLTLRLFVFI